MKKEGKLKSIVSRIPILSHFMDLIKTMEHLDRKCSSIEASARQFNKVLVADRIQTELRTNPRYQENGRLNKYEFQVYSQNGEDGIIHEIFKRIGTTNKFFVEFGASNGLENNTAFLLIEGWKGLWMEASEKGIQAIQNKFKELIDSKNLLLCRAFIEAETIQSLFEKNDVPNELDLLSIDIDGNDYWVWKAITDYRPRVVVIEYNAHFPPHTKWVMKYKNDYVWDLMSNYQGASLKSLELLGDEKGYKLVGCNYLGVNAFFVREDLVKGKFEGSFTAEHHYEPPRYHLLNRIGHARDFGEFERI